MNYTEEQIQVHGDLIKKWLDSGKTLRIEIYNKHAKEWQLYDSHPSWYNDQQYREAPEQRSSLFTNSIGEEFYEGVYNVYYFCFVNCRIKKSCFSDLEETYESCNKFTEIFLSKESLVNFMKSKMLG